MKKPSEETLELPIVAMIDIIFQLIIFFVVTAAQQKDIVDESIQLAKVKDTAQSPTEKKLLSTVTINVSEAGRINIGNVFLTRAEVTNILKETRAKFGNHVPIIIRCEGTAKFEHVDNVMRAVGAAGLYKIQIAATPTK